MDDAGYVDVARTHCQSEPYPVARAAVSRNDPAPAEVPRMCILQCLQVMCHLPLWLNVSRHRPPSSEAIVSCI